jgi:hypothetical protein
MGLLCTGVMKVTARKQEIRSRQEAVQVSQNQSKKTITYRDRYKPRRLSPRVFKVCLLKRTDLSWLIASKSSLKPAGHSLSTPKSQKSLMVARNLQNNLMKSPVKKNNPFRNQKTKTSKLGILSNSLNLQK